MKFKKGRGFGAHLIPPAFGVRSGTVVRACHGWNAAVLGDDARKDAIVTVALMDAPIAWPTRLARRRRRKFTLAAGSEMPPKRRRLTGHGRVADSYSRRTSAPDLVHCTLFRRGQPLRRHGRRASSRRAVASPLERSEESGLKGEMARVSSSQLVLISAGQSAAVGSIQRLALTQITDGPSAA